MNKLNISPSTYCEIEKQLGLLTDEGVNRLLNQLQMIVDTRRNVAMVEYEGLLKIIKLIKTLKIKLDDSYGNMLIIEEFASINNAVFDNRATIEEIKLWLMRDMLTDIAEMIDEGFRYGIDKDSDEAIVLYDLLFYLTVTHLRFIKN